MPPRRQISIANRGESSLHFFAGLGPLRRKPEPRRGWCCAWNPAVSTPSRTSPRVTIPPLQLEAISRTSPHSELEVAHEALRLAKEAEENHGREDRTAHVGFYLVNRGRPTLEAAMGSRVPLHTRLVRAARPLRLFLYLAPILVLTALLVTLPFGYVTLWAEGWARPLFFFIVGLIAASALVIPVVNMLVTLPCPTRCCTRL